MYFGPQWCLANTRLVSFASLSTPAVTAADMPLAYLLEQQPGDRCRFTDISQPIVFDADLTAPMAAQRVSSWRLFLLGYNNAGPDDTIRVVGAADLAHIGSPTYDSGVLPCWPSDDCEEFPRVHSRIWVPAGRPEPYLRCTVNPVAPRKPSAVDPSGFVTASYFEAGNLIVDFGYSPGDADKFALYATQDGLDEEQRGTTSEGGQYFPRIRPMTDRKLFNLVLGGANRAAEYALLQRFRRQTGLSRTVFFAQDLTGTSNQMETMTYGRLLALEDVSFGSPTIDLVMKIGQML